jgi:hypothetical protein
MFYPGKTHQFLEAMLNNPEKLRRISRMPKGVSDLTTRCSNGRPPEAAQALSAGLAKFLLCIGEFRATLRYPEQEP